MATNADVIKESTRVAQEAAKAAGLTFTPGATVNGSQITPTPVPANMVNLPQPDLKFPTTDNSDLASALSATKAMSSALTSQREADLTKEQDAYTSELKSLRGRQEQKPLALSQALEQAGVTNINKELQNLEGQIATRTAALESGLTNIEGKAIPMELLTGEQAQLRRQGLAEIGTLQARQQVLQGNLAAAKDAAQRAVDLIYAPEEQRIKNIQTYLELNAAQLTKEEKKKADLLTESLRLQSKELANKKTLQAYALNASANYPDAGILPGDDVQTVNNKIQASPTYKAKQRKLGVGDGGGGGKPVVTTGYVTDTGELTPEGEMAMARDTQNIQTLDSLKTHPGLNNAVGPGFKWFSRMGTPFTGSKADFIAEVEKLTSGLSLETLIEAKAKGATFGALSDSEMRILSSAATKIGSWRKLNSEGQVVGYKASEKSFKEELTNLSNFAKLDFVLKGGNPSDVGIIITDDGSYWIGNENGSLTLLRK